MDDLRMLLVVARRQKYKVALAAVLGACIVLYPGPKLEFTEISPDKSYRLEHWVPGPLSLMYYLYVRDMHLPGFARLYSNHDNTYYGESQVFDYIGGQQTYWMMDIDRTVGIGGEVTFTNVPPDSERYPKPE